MMARFDHSCQITFFSFALWVCLEHCIVLHFNAGVLY